MKLLVASSSLVLLFVLLSSVVALSVFAIEDDDSLLFADDNNDNLRLPTGLCQEDAVAFNNVFKNSSIDKTYFLSFDLCKPTNLTAAFLNLVPCGFGEFQIAQLPGTDYNKTFNNTDCGRVFNNHTVTVRNSSKVIARYFNNEDNTPGKNDLELTIHCIPDSEFVETFVVDFKNITWTNDRVLINSTGVCKDLAPTPAGPDDSGTSPGVYIAIAVVLTLVALFASVLYRAKLAGDRLRELKRARGERAFLG